MAVISNGIPEYNMNAIATTFIQIFMFLALSLTMGYALNMIFDQVDLDNFSFGFSTLFFSLILIPHNILIALVSKKMFVRMTFIFVSALYLIAWGEDLKSFPLSSLTFITSAIVTTALRSKIHYLLKDKYESL